MRQTGWLAVLVLYPFLGAALAGLAGGYGTQISAAVKRRLGSGSGKQSVKGQSPSETEERNGRYRDVLADMIVVSEFVLMAALFLVYAKGSDGAAAVGCTIPAVCGFGLNFTLDGFRMLYGLVAAFMWMMTTILSRQYFAHHGNRTRFYIFLLLTLGATMGVFLSADLYTTFIFFEIMSFTSYVWVAQEENEPSLRAAVTYLAVAVIGGLVMLMGIFLVYHELGTLTISELLPAARAYLGMGGEGWKDLTAGYRLTAEDYASRRQLLYAAGVCMLFGFGAKAGAFPLHIWLPKAHPVAPAPASALLSGILTKSGIFGILAVSCGLFLHDRTWGVLILTIGVLTMFGGALLAVFSVDLKRTLACSSMSQIGFILVGVGMQGLLGEENALAVHGTLLHMMNHSMIKLVLFMAAGVIFMNTHSLDLNEIRGYGRKKPLLKAIFLVGALAIGGIPLFGGYVSKTLLHESIVEYSGGFVMKAVEWMFLCSGGLTVAYMTKLFVSIFVEKNENPERQRRYDAQKRYMNAESTFALAGSALVLLIWGLCPHALMDRAAGLGQRFMHLEEFGHVVEYFSLKNLSGAMISIAIGALVYVFFIRSCLMRRENRTVIYINALPSWLDLENLVYRPLLLTVLPGLFGTVCKILDELPERVLHLVLPAGQVLCRVLDSLLDLSVVALRRTIYRDSPLPHELPEGNVVTAALGRIGNFLRNVLNRTVRRRDPVQRDYVHYLAVKYTELKESNMVIGRSMSFALLLLCIGFSLTLIYLIWM